MIWRVLCLSTFLGIAYSRYFIVGPAKIIFLSVDPCDNSSYSMQFELRTRMFNKSTQLLDAYWVLPFDIDENVMLSLRSSRIDKHKTQVNSFAIDDADACSTLSKYVGDLWIYVQTQIGMEPGVCPIKMGNYSVENMVLDLSKLNVHMLLEGQFKSRIMLKHGSKSLYCTDFLIELSPKNQ